MSSRINKQDYYPFNYYPRKSILNDYYFIIIMFEEVLIL